MIKLSEYFEAVERRICSKGDQMVHVPVRICQKSLIFHFQDRDLAAPRLPALKGMTEEESALLSGEADAEFFAWTCDPTDYVPPEGAGSAGVWVSRDQSGSLYVNSGLGLIGADHERRRYYFGQTPESDLGDRAGNHPMIVPLFRWALDSGMLVMHCAAAGAAGRGALICGRGGQGKSTLALSCMKLGMDFVSDDYVLLTGNGPLSAMPIYKTAGMNPDMEKVLGPGLPILNRENSFRDKLLLDASKVEYCSSLPIRAIIFPVLGDVPGIAKAEPGKALVQMIHSSITQLRVWRDPKINAFMLDRLKGLPVYEMRLGRDLMENAAYLRDFLMREFP